MTLSPTRSLSPPQRERVGEAGVRGPAFHSTESPSSAFGTFSPLRRGEGLSIMGDLAVAAPSSGVYPALVPAYLA